MDAERRQAEGARRALETASGTVLKATRRGALVLETENARRMMQRFRKLKPVREGDPAQDPEPA
jgi:hypothetical protein